MSEHDFKHLLATLIVISYLRTYEFARLSRRMELVVQTLRASVSAILALGVAVSLVVFSYSVAAYVMYSGTHYEFVEFGRAISTMGMVIVAQPGIELFCGEPTCEVSACVCTAWSALVLCASPMPCGAPSLSLSLCVCVSTLLISHSCTLRPHHGRPPYNLPPVSQRRAPCLCLSRS